MRSTDRDWEEFGKRDPYYGVLTEDRFRSARLNEQALAEFFESGRDWVDRVLARIGADRGGRFAPANALDFGCGVGRMVLPLSERCGHVDGMDVSPSVLAEAARNLESRGIRNATLLRSDDRLSELRGRTYDLIHSYIVFQHIPVKRGRAIYARLLDHLSDDGWAVLHFTYYRRAPWVRKALNRLRRVVPFVNGAVNVLQGKRFGEPTMQMNAYPLHLLLEEAYRHGISTGHFDITDEAGFRGVVLFLRRRTTLS